MRATKQIAMGPESSLAADKFREVQGLAEMVIMSLFCGVVGCVGCSEIAHFC